MVRPQVFLCDYNFMFIIKNQYINGMPDAEGVYAPAGLEIDGVYGVGADESDKLFPICG